jgi:hypothetical protein
MAWCSSGIFISGRLRTSSYSRIKAVESARVNFCSYRSIKIWYEAPWFERKPETITFVSRTTGINYGSTDATKIQTRASENPLVSRVSKKRTAQPLSAREFWVFTFRLKQSLLPHLHSPLGVASAFSGSRRTLPHQTSRARGWREGGTRPHPLVKAG